MPIGGSASGPSGPIASRLVGEPPLVRAVSVRAPPSCAHRPYDALSPNLGPGDLRGRGRPYGPYSRPALHVPRNPALVQPIGCLAGRALGTGGGTWTRSPSRPQPSASLGRAPRPGQPCGGHGWPPRPPSATSPRPATSPARTGTQTGGFSLPAHTRHLAGSPSREPGRALGRAGPAGPVEGPSEAPADPKGRTTHLIHTGQGELRKQEELRKFSGRNYAPYIPLPSPPCSYA